MKSTLLVGLSLFINHMVWAQNYQVKWSRAQALQDGSATFGIPLSGKGLTINIFESFPLLTGHQEFGERASNVGSFTTSQSTIYSHSTEVASIAAASGVNLDAKGVASQANIRLKNALTFLTEWTTPADLAQDLVANLSFSYGDPLNNSRAYTRFGTYTTESNTADYLAWAKPYSLIVTGAGNDGELENLFPNTFPITWDYDKIYGGPQIAKNSLTVGNLKYASFGLNSDILAAYMSRTTSAGPTDDLRVKPEITAPGTLLTTAKGSGLTIGSSDYYSSYTNVSGTSMATPVVSGSVLLLQELYQRIYQQYLRAATIKGLLIHGADKIYPPVNYMDNTVTVGIGRNPGPDPFCGYGLINVTASAKAILNRGFSSIVDEKTLKQGRFDIVDIPTQAGKPVTVSISWTDLPKYPPETPITAVTNIETAMLVNDLGVVVIETSKAGGIPPRTLYPFSFVHDADKKISAVSDRLNKVDPYEQVRFTPLPEHTYTILVSHQGATLEGGQQDYSLIVTGLGDDPQLNNGTCAATLTVSEPIRVGTHLAAQDQITIQTEVTESAGYTEFNALYLILVDGALIHNGDVLLEAQSCSSVSDMRQASQASSMAQEPEESETALQIYPNPVERICFIKSKTPINSLALYSLEGRILWQQEGLNDLDKQVDLSNLTSGSYLLKVTDTAGKVFIRRLIK